MNRFIMMMIMMLLLSMMNSCSCSSSNSGDRSNVKLFDSHCHLQDPRIYNLAPQIIQTAIESGVTHFAVNGVSEYDWILVKKMSEDYPSSVIPCFGLHPWFITNRTSNWYNTLRDFFNSTPSATVGEIGLDKSPLAQQFDFNDQVQIFTQQLALSKELKKPVSVHCLLAFDELIEIMQSIGPFPAGVILHSYAGSAELVPTLTKLGAYFSFSGHNMNSEPQKAKEILKSIPIERILLESDAPDALPRSMNDTYNQPANIPIVLRYVASMLEMPEQQLAALTNRNALYLFSSYPGSKLN